MQTKKRFSRTFRFAVLALVAGLAASSAAQAQVRPYLGYVYPAGGQQGTTFEVRLGGQGMDNNSSVQVSGKGVRAKVIEYLRRLNNEEMNLLKEQLAELKRATKQDDESLKLAARIERQNVCLRGHAGRAPRSPA